MFSLALGFAVYYTRHPRARLFESSSLYNCFELVFDVGVMEVSKGLMLQLQAIEHLWASKILVER